MAVCFDWRQLFLLSSVALPPIFFASSNKVVLFLLDGCVSTKVHISAILANQSYPLISPLPDMFAQILMYFLFAKKANLKI